MHLRKIVLLLFIVGIFLLSSNETVFAEEVRIEGSNLNVRSGPGTEHESIGSTDTGDTFPLIEELDGWVEIDFHGETGYISSEFVTVSGAEDNTSTEDAGVNENTENADVQSITIQHDQTQLRDGPSTEHEIVHFAEKGSEFDVLSVSSNWYKVSDDDVTGYLYKDLVEESNNTSLDKRFKNKTIVIDAGHGGRDVGAIGAKESYEKNIAYMTAKELEKELNYLGADVRLTRQEDEFISLTSRPTYSNLYDTDAFISIHYNSTPKLPNVSGVETYYYAKQHKSLAKYIQQGIVKDTDVRDRGIAEGDLSVLRQNIQPSVLLELGFLSNPESEALLNTTAYQKKLVSGIVTGLGRYFNEVTSY